MNFKPQNQGRLTWLLVLILLLFLVTAICPLNLTIGDWHIRKSLERIARADDWPKGFHQTGWDGPTGSFSSGDIFTLRIAQWVWRLDIYNEGLPEI